MLYITLKRNFNYKFSYIAVLVNSKRRILKKLGTLSFNKVLGLFVLNIDIMLLFFFFRNGIYFSKKFYILLYFCINGFKL